MTKGVFETKAGSGYDDEVAERYHFPHRYLAVAQTLVGDWIAYREPRTGGGRGSYIAAARVVRIDPDPARSDHHYARVDGYLSFNEAVPLSRDGIYYPRRFADEARSSLPGLDGAAAPDPGEVFAALRMQRLRLRHDQQVPEWAG